MSAGERAASLGASENAQRYVEQAIELSESQLRRAELHEQAGELAVLARSAESARAHLEGAIALFEEQHLTHSAARVSAKLGIVTWHLEADIEQAMADMEQAFSVLECDERDADLAPVAVQLARALYFSGRVDEAMERNELALEIAEELELLDALSHGLNTKAIILGFARGRRQEATVLMRHALHTALVHDRSDAALRGYNNLASFLSEEELREALEHTYGHEALARRVGDRGQLLQALNWRCGLSLALGEWDEALEIARSSESREKWMSLWMAALHARRGELDEARRYLAMAAEDYDPNELQQVVHHHAMEALVLLAEGKPGEALRSAEVALDGRSTVGLAQVDGARVSPGGCLRVGEPGEDRRVARDHRAGAAGSADILVEGDRCPLRSAPLRAAARRGDGSRGVRCCGWARARGRPGV